MVENSARVAVVIVNYRTPDLTLRCIAALANERARLPALRAVVVDGGSADGSAEALRVGLDQACFDGWVELLALPVNGGFGWANNQAILGLLQGSAAPQFIYLLNPDAMMEPGALSQLLSELERHPRCGACGSRLVNEHGETLSSAFRFPTLSREFTRGVSTALIARALGVKELVIDTDVPMEVDWVTGASVLFRSAALCETGLFDDGFFLYFEEVELMWRLRRAGWSVRHAPASRVLHIGGAATGVGGDAEQRRRRLPAYWYESRRRFFVLCYGPWRAFAAGILWLLGYQLWRLRFWSRRRNEIVPRERSDHLRIGLIPKARDARHSAPTWNTAPGAEAAWMRPGR